DAYGLRAERDYFEDPRETQRGTKFSSARDRLRDGREIEKNFYLKLAEGFIRTIIPVPLVRNAFELASNILTGIGIGGLTSQNGNSKNYITKNGDFYSSIILTETNGVLTSFKEFKMRCENIAEATGIKVIGTYNSTHGLALDLIESLFHMVDLPTEVTNL